MSRTSILIYSLIVGSALVALGDLPIERVRAQGHVNPSRIYGVHSTSSSPKLTRRLPTRLLRNRVYPSRIYGVHPTSSPLPR